MFLNNCLAVQRCGPNRWIGAQYRQLKRTKIVQSNDTASQLSKRNLVDSDRCVRRKVARTALHRAGRHNTMGSAAATLFVSNCCRLCPLPGPARAVGGLGAAWPGVPVAQVPQAALPVAVDRLHVSIHVFPDMPADDADGSPQRAMPGPATELEHHHRAAQSTLCPDRTPQQQQKGWTSGK
jgi:hypothetical protein